MWCMIYYAIAFFGIMNVGHASAYNHFLLLPEGRTIQLGLDGILRGLSSLT